MLIEVNEKLMSLLCYAREASREELDDGETGMMRKIILDRISYCDSIIVPAQSYFRKLAISNQKTWAL